MKNLVKLAAALMLAAMVAVSSACSQVPPGDDSAAASVAPGFPSQSLRDQARALAYDFWHNQLGANGELLVGCAQGFTYVNDDDLSGTDGAYAIGCSAKTEDGSGAYVPGPDPGPPAYIALNPHVRWTLKRLCPIVTHEFGHLVGKMHANASQYAVMDPQPQIGDAWCPNP